MTSLKDREDISFLAGSTSYKELMLYLKCKYHRPDEFASTILGRVHDFKVPGNDKAIQKHNMLEMQNIRRDLARVRMKSQLDVYYIKQAGPRVFTTDEHSAYLKAKMRDTDDRMILTKKKKKLARTLAVVALPMITSSALLPAVAGGAPPAAAGSDHPSEDDRFNELDAADRIRALDVDSDSGSESDADSDLTAIGSMFSKARISEDKDSRHDRKFFFDYITHVLALTRMLDGLAFANGSADKSGKPRKNNSAGFFTNTETDWVCVLPNCNESHQTPRKRPTQSLTFCTKFTAKKLAQRIQDFQKFKVCARCLQPGHNVAACKQLSSTTL